MERNQQNYDNMILLARFTGLLLEESGVIPNFVYVVFLVTIGFLMIRSAVIYLHTKKYDYRYFYGMVASMVVLELYIFAVNLPAYLPAMCYDDIISEEIKPMTGRAKMKNFYPWGISVELSDSRVRRFRVENPDSFVVMVNDGAIISKREKSSDIIVVKDTLRSCFPINNHLKKRNGSV